MLRKEIGLRVKNIRLSMNMTKQKMAELLGIKINMHIPKGKWQERKLYGRKC